MAAVKGTPTGGEKNPLRLVLFILSIVIGMLCFYLMLDFQSSSEAKLSGELILGQVDTVSYAHQDAPVLSFLFEYFGALSYLFALAIIYLGYFLLLRPIDIWHADFYKGCLRIMGFNFLLLGSAALFSRYSDLGSTGAGGLLGDMLNMFCDLVLPDVLSVFIFALVAFSGICFLVGKNPMFVFERLGETFFKVLPASAERSRKSSKKKTAGTADTAVAADAAAAVGAAGAAVAEASDEVPADMNAVAHNLDVAGESVGAEGTVAANEEAADNGALNEVSEQCRDNQSGVVRDNADNSPAPEERVQGDMLGSRLVIPDASQLGLNDDATDVPQQSFNQALNDFGVPDNVLNPNSMEAAFTRGAAQAALRESGENAQVSPQDFFAQVMNGTHSIMEPGVAAAAVSGAGVTTAGAAGAVAVGGAGAVQARQLDMSGQGVQVNNAGGYDQDNSDFYQQSMAGQPEFSGQQGLPDPGMPEQPGMSYQNDMPQDENGSAVYGQYDGAGNVPEGIENYSDNSGYYSQDQERNVMADAGNMSPLDALKKRVESAPDSALMPDTAPVIDEPYSDPLADTHLQQSVTPMPGMPGMQHAFAQDNEAPVNNLPENVDSLNQAASGDESAEAEIGGGDYAQDGYGQWQQYGQDIQGMVPADTKMTPYQNYNNEVSGASSDQDGSAASMQAESANAAAAGTADAGAAVAPDAAESFAGEQVAAASDDINPAEYAADSKMVSGAGIVSDRADESKSRPDEAVHTRIIRTDPAELKKQQEAAAASAAAVAAAEAEAAAAEAEVEEEAEEYSPYGYGTYAAKQEREQKSARGERTDKSRAKNKKAAVEEASRDEAAGKTEGEDNNAVHTIVHRVDPKVFAAEQEARRREREEALKREQEEAKQREEAEARQREEEEAKRLEAERLKAEAEAARKAEEEAAAAAAAAVAAAEAEAEEAEEESDSDEDDDAPIYAGTYASQLMRSQKEQEASQEKSGSDKDADSSSKKKKKKNKRKQEQTVLAEPNTHEIGVRLPEEERPHTIIRDTRKEFEAEQAARAAAKAAAEAAAAEAAATAGAATAAVGTVAAESTAAGAGVEAAVAADITENNTAASAAVDAAESNTEASSGPSTLIMRSEPGVAAVPENVSAEDLNGPKPGQSLSQYMATAIAQHQLGKEPDAPLTVSSMMQMSGQAEGGDAVAAAVPAAKAAAATEAAAAAQAEAAVSGSAGMIGDSHRHDDIFKELSSLASEFRDVSSNVSSFISKQEDAAHAAVAGSKEAAEQEGAVGSRFIPEIVKNPAPRPVPVQVSEPEPVPEPEADRTPATSIQRGSGAPEQGYQNQGGHSRTTIIRSGSASGAVEVRNADNGVDDDSFYRYAVSQDNRQNNHNGHSVSVDLFGTDDEISSDFTPRHAYDFGGKGQQAGELDESLSGTDPGDADDEFFTGATREDHSLGQPGRPHRTNSFNFTELAQAKAQAHSAQETRGAGALEPAVPEHQENSREQGAEPGREYEDKFSRSFNREDNIIDFSRFSRKETQSYEVDGLTSAFIPMSGENGEDEGIYDHSAHQHQDHDYNQVHTPPETDSDNPVSTAPEMESVDTSFAGQESGSASYEQTPAPAEAEPVAVAPVAADAAAAAAAAAEMVSAAEPEFNGAEESGAAAGEPDEAALAMMQQMAAGQASGMGVPGMYQGMAGGQQMPYMQLPNGQMMPVMGGQGMMYPNMGQMPMGMQPNMPMTNMAMGNMPQYMQLPNGQVVPVMQNQGMMYPGMGQIPMGMTQQGMMQVAQSQGMMPGVMGEGMMAESEAAWAQAQSQGQSQVSAQAEMMPEQAQPVAAATTAATAAAAQVAPAAAEEPSAQEMAHTMGEHGPSGVGLPTAGNAFMGAHNSSSSNLPGYMAGVSQGSDLSFDVKKSLSLCSVPRRHYDDWRPSLDLLARSNSHVDISQKDLEKTEERINSVLHSYGIKASVADYLTGPVITRFDLELAPGVKSSAISSIETELCRNLLVANVRVVPIIEGSSYVGLEVPNPERQFITLGDMASSRDFQESDASLPMCLGASVIGAPVVKDLADSPHLLVAGTTGSGKSAGLNTMLISLLLKRSPAELRLILVDPKQLEFSIYRDLPHLITPVITDVAEKTPIALNWCVDEMERRFKLMSLLNVRKLAEYNDLIKKAKAQGRSIPDPLWTAEMGPVPQPLEPLPWIVVVVEEFADLMAQSGRRKDKENTPESLIARLSAKSRAAGIHLVLVTQTPRSEVVTGMIKANFPSRVAFTVQNRIDSTIVLDEKGAECLLGNGDMLYKFTGAGTATRAHGAFTSNADVQAVVDAWRQHAGAPEYLEDVIAVPEEPSEEGEQQDKPKELDVKFDQAVSVVRDYMDSRNKPPTVTDLQTELGVGYPRAKKIYKQLTTEGIID